MHVLFAISVLALVALLWASAAIVQHVRRSHRRQRRTQADSTAATANAATGSHAAPPPAPRPISYAVPSGASRPPSFSDLASRLAAAPPTEAIRAATEKPPPTSPTPPSERTDWPYFNKDMGDLSDPQAPRRKRDVQAITDSDQQKTA